MKYTIVMQTCNREELVGKPNLIVETIGSLIDSGLWESNIDFHLVIHDSGSRDLSFLEPLRILKNTTITKCPNKEVNIRNVQTSFSYVLKNFQSDYVINIEDDIIFCKNWIQNIDGWIRKHTTSDDIFFAFFTPYNIPKLMRDSDPNIQVWSDYMASDFYGNQCVAFPFNQLDNAIRTLDEEKRPEYNADIVFQRWFQKYSKDAKIKCSIPCLVQHRNANTTLMHGSTVLSFTFLGEDIDPEFYHE